MPVYDRVRRPVNVNRGTHDQRRGKECGGGNNWWRECVAAASSLETIEVWNTSDRKKMSCAWKTIEKCVLALDEFSYMNMRRRSLDSRHQRLSHGCSQSSCWIKKEKKRGMYIYKNPHPPIEMNLTQLESINGKMNSMERSHGCGKDLKMRDELCAVFIYTHSKSALVFWSNTVRPG